MKTILATVTYAENGCYVESVKLKLSDTIIRNIKKANQIINSYPEFKAIEILATGSLLEMYSEDVNDLREGFKPELDTTTGKIDCERISISDQGVEFSCCYKYSGENAFTCELNIKT